MNYFSLKEKKGVLVSQVLANSPAKKAGIKEGDLILKFNNVETNNVNTLLKAVSEAEAGKKVKAELQRDKMALALEVEVGVRPENLEEQLSAPKGTEESVVYWRGIRVMEINSELARRYRLGKDEGVVVVAIKPNSEADEAGIIEGDIVLEINKTFIDTLTTYNKVIKSLSGDCLVRTSRGFFVLKGGKN
jgi:serine protease Do